MPIRAHDGVYDNKYCNANALPQRIVSISYPFATVLLPLDSTADEEDLSMQRIRCRPTGVDDLVVKTNFSRREIQMLYRGFKEVCVSALLYEELLLLRIARTASSRAHSFMTSSLPSFIAHVSFWCPIY